MFKLNEIVDQKTVFVMEPLTVSLSPLFLSLTVASAAMWISFESREEIVRLFTRAVALFSLLCALSFTPWFILLIFVTLLLGIKNPRIEKKSLKL
ncbi:hypothetical protein M595_3242 [Lyngbya aestuarii BL J]|uniref:Uncharacterized protein n=1 Tax=Lyngbya aestuarii BL J TaxID=1348334 RepID=U7QK22_9CYAN|nr:hypothetical protein [Lyngbya aestuarii]ERT06781.1 hypothetical protein M595_3242 [Lyngbya aestuarii BL J]